MRKLCFTLASYVTMQAMMTTSVQAQSYCENGAMFPGYFWIDSVISDTFDNTTGPVPDIPADFDRYTTSYADYTDQVISWQVGPNPLELFSGTLFPGIPMAWQVWIDLNSDQVFSTEELFVSSQADMVSETIDLSGIGLDSDLNTRMRISLSYGQPAPPCGSFLYGEVEDYTVTIVAPVVSTVRVPEDFTSIQAAIDAAMPGDRVLVNDGVYDEFLVVDKPLTLESVSGYQNTVIAGAANSPTVMVEAPNVTLRGFDLSGTNDHERLVQFNMGADNGRVIDSFCGAPISNNNDALFTNIFINGANGITVDGFVCDQKGSGGIFAINSDNSSFINNVLTGYRDFGMTVVASSDGVIADNVVNNSQGDGIKIRNSQRFNISGNECSGHVFDLLLGQGIDLSRSHEITVSNNQCRDNGDTGINIGLSEDVQLLGNILENNRNYGIYAFEAHRLMGESNSIDGSNRGFFMARSDDVIFTGNTIQNSVLFGLGMQEQQGSTIEENVLLNNISSLFLKNSAANIIRNNVMDFMQRSPAACDFNFENASGNQIFLNTIMAAQAIDFCIDQFSINQWHSPTDIDYEFRGGQFSGLMGNYYSDGNHADSEMDGIADQPYLIDDLQIIDDHSLAYEVYRYNFN